MQNRKKRGSNVIIAVAVADDIANAAAAAIIQSNHPFLFLNRAANFGLYKKKILLNNYYIQNHYYQKNSYH